MNADPNASTKLAIVAFTAFLLGVAATGLFVWLDPFHVLGHTDRDDFRSYRDRGAAPIASEPETPGHFACDTHPKVIEDAPGFCRICGLRLTSSEADPAVEDP